jgi:hypothetical protein
MRVPMPLYQLLEAYYDDVKAVWEERFKKNTASGEASSTWYVSVHVPQVPAMNSPSGSIVAPTT